MPGWLVDLFVVIGVAATVSLLLHGLVTLFRRF